VYANLLAELDDARFGANARLRAEALAREAGFALRRTDGAADERLAAWIDLHFAPSGWSSEVRAGSAWVAERDGEIGGFAAFAARGLRFFWLRGYGERRDVGIFGPYGVAPAHRGTGIGEALLLAALAGLREAGHGKALIPAVRGERLIATYEARTGATIVERFDLSVARARTSILASGAGTNARNVLERVRDGTLPLDVRAVIANDANAGALEAAREHGVAAIPVVWDRAVESRAEFDARVAEATARTEPELVLLLGWMHLLAPAFLQRFPQTINLHPAFLPHDSSRDEVVMPDGSVVPALRGAHALRDALRAGAQWTGATVHYVTPATDRGEVLVRIPMRVDDATTEHELRERIRPLEFAAVPAAIRRWSFER